jgi:hypothetical protein
LGILSVFLIILRVICKKCKILQKKIGSGDKMPGCIFRPFHKLKKPRFQCQKWSIRFLDAFMRAYLLSHRRIASGFRQNLCNCQ